VVLVYDLTDGSFKINANFISVCSILLRINTNIIINECPLSQHCFNII
jgi:hypothetical protein